VVEGSAGRASLLDEASAVGLVGAAGHLARSQAEAFVAGREGFEDG
jgi:hypothetical protein